MEIMTRAALYELVWSEPVMVLAARLGISDAGLAKQCRRANIPLPPRGYWARLDAGQSIERTPLPEASRTGSGVVAIGKRSLPTESHLPPEEPDDLVDPQAPVFPDDILEMTGRLRASVKKVSIPPLSRKTHPLVARLLERDAMVRSNIGPLAYRTDGPLDSRFERRRLRLLNALLLALEVAGSKPQMRDARGRDLAATVGTTLVPFRFDSPRVFRRRWKAADGDRLELRIGSEKKTADHMGTWNEKTQPIDRQLAEIVVGILVAGELLRREHELERHRAAVKHRELLEAEERRKREEAEQARVKQLLAEAATFRQAADLRAFVAAARLAQVVPPTECRSGTTDWAAWALAVADRIDPLVAIPPIDEKPGTSLGSALRLVG